MWLVWRDSFWALPCWVYCVSHWDQYITSQKLLSATECCIEIEVCVLWISLDYQALLVYLDLIPWSQSPSGTVVSLDRDMVLTLKSHFGIEATFDIYPTTKINTNSLLSFVSHYKCSHILLSFADNTASGSLSHASRRMFPILQDHSRRRTPEASGISEL